jgi:PEP-CTERM motif
MARIICITSALLAFPCKDAAADLIAYWNFNSWNGSGTPISATLGSGTLSITGFPADDLLILPGTTVNAVGADPAGNSLGLENNINNGNFLALSFSMGGHTGLSLSYASRRTTTGFNSDQWSYSTDGISFTPFGSAVNPTTSTTFGLVTLDISAATTLNDDATVFLRYTLNGATNSSGNNRVDNVQLNASLLPVASLAPEPSSFVMMGLGVLGLICVVNRKPAFMQGS